PEGSDGSLHTAEGMKAVRSGRPVLIIDPFVEGPVRTRESRGDSYFLSYNRSVAAERVQDILTAAAYLKSQKGGKLELIGLGDAGLWCVFAAAIAPTSIDVVADMNGFGGSDEEFRERFFVPGIQRAGGLPTALRLVDHVRTILRAPGEANEA